MIRRAHALVFYCEGRALIALNFLTKQSCAVGHTGLALLAALGDWRPLDDLLDALCSQGVVLTPMELSDLLSAGVVVRLGSAEAIQDEEYRRNFVWGAPVGYYHFGIRNTAYMSPLQFSSWMATRVAEVPAVPLHRPNPSSHNNLGLPPVRVDLDGMPVMRRRRSFRGFSDEPVSLQELGDCLFAGLGITGFLKGSQQGEGYLPISMTPSGGGRNPYEAYIYARNVAGLAPGTYHYAAVDHSLALVNATFLPEAGEVLAGQPWFNNTAALVLLVANFERTMWKYPHPTGYRVVVLEAGHIAQNIILAATAHRLASAPTCAICDAVAEKLTGCSSVTQTTMYSVALGHKSAVPTVVDPLQIIANDAALARDHGSSTNLATDDG